VKWNRVTSTVLHLLSLKIALDTLFLHGYFPSPSTLDEFGFTGPGRPEGGIMRKWGIALAAAGLLAGAASAGDLKYVPVNTSRNLVAPVPVYGAFAQRKSWLGRVGDSIKSLSPFNSKKAVLPTPPGPLLPAAANLAGKAVNVAKSPTFGVSASAK
jgi:hypothetical protein